MVALGLVAAGCGVPPGEDVDSTSPHSRSSTRTKHRIRPTEADGWQGNAYGDDVGVERHTSPGGAFKVWYTERGPNAAPARDDAPMDGVPDFPQTVAKRLDETRRVLVDQAGFWPPLDDSIYHDGDDYGGDDRFDVYLQDLEQNDGYRVVEGCVPGPPRCAGYFVMENDFRGFSYPSREVAIEVVASHEYMHAVLDAYTTQLPRFLTEGFATWAEERVFPGQQDYERLVRVFFRQTDRPLSSGDSGDFTDLFAYGAAIWPTYLHQRFGDELLHELLLEISNAVTNDSRDLWDATDGVLRDHGSTFTESFVRFALWNLLTGTRAGLLPEAGYRDAGRLPEARVRRIFPNTSGRSGALVRVSTKHLSAKYRVLDLREIDAGAAELVAKKRLGFALFATGSSGATGPVFLRPAGALDRGRLSLPSTGNLYVVAVNTETEEGERKGRLEIRPSDVGRDTGVADAGDSSTTDTGGAPRVDGSDAVASETTPRSGGRTAGGCSSSGRARPRWWPGVLLIICIATRGIRRSPCDDSSET